MIGVFEILAGIPEADQDLDFISIENWRHTVYNYSINVRKFPCVSLFGLF